MKAAARPYRCASRIRRQFTQIHSENSIVYRTCHYVIMKFLILICALVPICASESILDSDGWLMQDLQDRIYEPIRVRRQAPQQQGHAQQQQQQPQVQYRPYSQAPSQIKELLQFQQARQPLVHLPAQPPPNIGPSKPIEPVLQSQSQAAGYRPQVQFGNAPQQPMYKNQAAAIAAQYRPQGQPQGQPQYQPQGQPQYQPQGQPQYQPQGQPQYQPQAQPQYQPQFPQPQGQPQYNQQYRPQG